MLDWRPMIVVGAQAQYQILKIFAISIRKFQIDERYSWLDECFVHRIKVDKVARVVWSICNKAWNAKKSFRILAKP